MTALWIGVGLWVIAMAVLAPLVGRLIRNGRRGEPGPPVVWDGSGDQWNRNHDGTYRLAAENSDGRLQAMSLDDIEQAFGSVTLQPPAEQDPTT